MRDTSVVKVDSATSDLITLRSVGIAGSDNEEAPVASDWGHRCEPLHPGRCGVGDSTEVIQGLLDKLGFAEAEAERLRASLATVQTRLMAESALADELAEVLGRCANMLTVQGVSNGIDTRVEQGRAEAVLARWAESRRR